MWTIKKNGKYVTIGGRESSYTTDPKFAVKYTTYEQAKANACDNEQVVQMMLKWQ